MNKKTKYAVNGAILIGTLNAILNAIKQFNEISDNPNLKFNWKRFIAAAGKGVLVGGAGGFAIGAVVDYNNSNVKPVDTDMHLMKLTDEIRLHKNDSTYLKLNEKAELLIGMLVREYGTLIQATPRLGSTENGTALKEKFDIDLGVNFKPNAFTSTEEMFLSVLNLFENKIGYATITKVRGQKKSIGVFVKIDEIEHKIDVVPCKLTNGGRGSGYLYVNDNSLFGTASYTKTNIRVLNSIKLSPTQQKLAIALKRWKIKNNLAMSSHLLQNLILDAYKYAPRIPSGITAKVVLVLNHIVNDLSVVVIRGQENTNNIITNIPESAKEEIIRAAKETIEDYKYQPNSIISILS
jgi:hypothetical protein